MGCVVIRALKRGFECFVNYRSEHVNFVRVGGGGFGLKPCRETVV